MMLNENPPANVAQAYEVINTALASAQFAVRIHQQSYGTISRSYRVSQRYVPSYTSID